MNCFKKLVFVMNL